MNIIEKRQLLRSRLDSILFDEPATLYACPLKVKTLIADLHDLFVEEGDDRHRITFNQIDGLNAAANIMLGILKELSDD